MNSEKNKEKWVKQVEDILKLGGRSIRTIDNYRSCINRFLSYYPNDKNIKLLKEKDIIFYFINEIDTKGKSNDTYNLNLCAIKFLFSVCFNKELNRKLLPTKKLQKKLPTIISKKEFLNIFNNEKNLKHQCWLLLAFCSGLRVEEIATLKIENIFSKEHKLKVLGKRNKERFTILPDIVIKFLRLYYKKHKLVISSGYLFPSISNHSHINPKSISNYFTITLKKYTYIKNTSFHTLRHSFATYCMMNGMDIVTLKEIMGHNSIQTTTIYIHLSQNFNNLKGINYGK